MCTGLGGLRGFCDIWLHYVGNAHWLEPHNYTVPKSAFYLDAVQCIVVSVLGGLQQTNGRSPFSHLSHPNPYPNSYPNIIPNPKSNPNLTQTLILTLTNPNLNSHSTLTLTLTLRRVTKVRK